MVISMCKALEPYRPFFIEDPIRSENPGSYRKLARHISLPIAAGEQWASKWPFREVIEEELISYARIDLCIVGGLTEALKIAHWCETHYIKLATHNPLGPVSSAACLQLNLACPNVGVQEQPRKPGTTLTDVVPVQPVWEDGYLLPPERPGLGVVFDREAAKASPMQTTELPHLHREDGSFTNW
jgi:galactonate dehydratase